MAYESKQKILLKSACASKASISACASTKHETFQQARLEARCGSWFLSIV